MQLKKPKMGLNNLNFQTGVIFYYLQYGHANFYEGDLNRVCSVHAIDTCKILQ